MANFKKLDGFFVKLFARKPSGNNGRFAMEYEHEATQARQVLPSGSRSATTYLQTALVEFKRVRLEPAFLAHRALPQPRHQIRQWRSGDWAEIIVNHAQSHAQRMPKSRVDLQRRIGVPNGFQRATAPCTGTFAPCSTSTGSFNFPATSSSVGRARPSA